MKKLTLALAIVAFVIAAGGNPVFAQNRTDVADGTWSQNSISSQSTGASTFNRSRSDYLLANGSGGSHLLVAVNKRLAFSSSVAATSNAGTAFLLLYLYEPEKMGRKIDQIKLSQKTQIGAQLGIVAAGSAAVTTSRTVVLTDCGMKASAKGIDAIGATNQLKMKAKCKDLTTQLSLTPDEETALFRILAITELTDKSLAVKSKTASYMP